MILSREMLTEERAWRELQAKRQEEWERNRAERDRQWRQEDIQILQKELRLNVWAALLAAVIVAAATLMGVWLGARLAALPPKSSPRQASVVSPQRTVVLPQADSPASNLAKPIPNYIPKAP
jgi:hypothetical protein